MPTIIRYPLIGGLALFLIACGSSGSQRLFSQTTPDSDSTSGTSYSTVEYLLEDDDAIAAAIEKFVEDPETPADTDATESQATGSGLSLARHSIVSAATRYLSSGALLVQTDGGVSNNFLSATCSGEAGSTAKCEFKEDNFREEVTFHVGRTNTGDEVNDVGFQNFRADRQPVMDYRNVRLSQVRSAGVDMKPKVDEDDSDLFIYEDAQGNEYKFTQDKIDGYESDPNDDTIDANDLPDEVAVEDAPEFSDLTRATVDSEYDYVGYDGILRHSMFFVGAYKFFDEDGDLEHLRFENASLGKAYDSNSLNAPDAENPGFDLTGNGVMVGMESDNDSLEHYLVQGDVEINYVYVSGSSTVDIMIDNIQRLGDDDPSWFATETFSWSPSVMASKFEDSMDDLVGHFYGTGDVYEVGGVFRRDNDDQTLVGAFGAELEKEPDNMNGN